MGRECKLGVACGKKAIGKTYITNQILQEYVKGGKGFPPRRVLIMDVNDEYEQYRAISLHDIERFSIHPTIEIRRIRPFNPDGKRMTLREIADTLWTVLETFRHGAILIEDINRYVSDYLPNDLIGAICTNRHTDQDIIMHFQSIGRISPKIWQNMNWLRFHKNSDSVERHKTKFPDKYQMLKVAENIVNNQYYNNDEYFFLYVDIDTEKINGKITEEMMAEAIDDFVSLNHNFVVKPYINKRDSRGKKIHTPESAILEAKRIMRLNFGRE